MTLRGTSLIDNILDGAILAVQAGQPAEVRGRAHLLPDGRIGKFGWKAATPTLVEFMAEALRDERGVTSPLLPRDLVDGCDANDRRGKADAVPLTSLVHGGQATAASAAFGALSAGDQQALLDFLGCI